CQLRYMGFQADRVDTTTGAYPAGEILQSGEDAYVFLGVIDCYRPNGTGQLQAFGKSVNGNDASGAQHESAGDCKLPDGTATPDSNGIIFLDLGILRSHVTGREDIGKE